MTRTAKIYARLQSQKSGSVRHIKYLFDGHGTNDGAYEFWTKGIQKSMATPQELPKVWSEIDKKWRMERDTGGSVDKKSTVKYMQCLIALPNDISEIERHRTKRGRIYY